MEQKTDFQLPIEPELLKKRAAIPKLIAELSYKDEEKAIHFIRIWGEKRTAITPLYAELMDALELAAEEEK